MRDNRIDRLADVLVNYSVHCRKGEKVLIEARGIDAELVNACIEQVFAAGGYPFAEIVDQRVERALLLGTSKAHCELRAKYAKYRMEDMDCYIGIRGGDNAFELSDVPAANMQVYDRTYSFPVHHETRVKKTKWVVLRYPVPAMAQQACMSTEAFEDYYFHVCNLDYSRMSQAMDALVREYGRILVAGAPVFMASSFLQAFVRNDKAPKKAMAAVISGGVLNVVLDYLFIFPMGMGMAGGAIATVIGTVYQNVLSFFFTVMFTIYFLSSKERLRSQVKNLMRAYLKPRWVEKALSVADLSQRTFSSFITGQCLEACILGGMFFVTMTLLGMPYVLLISVFIAVRAHV